jgi:anti-sigma B factor antagonist
MMSGDAVAMDVRELSPRTSVVDIKGDVTAASEGALMDAYSKASGPATRVLVLNFSGLQYMNSGGIGMLVTVLVRANRQRQQLLAFGLNDHYRQIFELTRLDEAIGIHETEADALAAAGERRAGRDTP